MAGVSFPEVDFTLLGIDRLAALSPCRRQKKQGNFHLDVATSPADRVQHSIPKPGCSFWVREAMACFLSKIPATSSGKRNGRLFSPLAAWRLGILPKKGTNPSGAARMGRKSNFQSRRISLLCCQQTGTGRGNQAPLQRFGEVLGEKCRLAGGKGCFEPEEFWQGKPFSRRAAGQESGKKSNRLLIRALPERDEPPIRSPTNWSDPPPELREG